MYKIEDGIVLSEKRPRRGGKRGSKYPFDLLNVGQNFRVPVSEHLPEPKDVAAALASSSGCR